MWYFENYMFDALVDETYYLRDYVGFVYKITNKQTKRFYIGKKHFHIGSEWRNYYGSSKLLNKDIKIYGKDSFTREILCLCKDENDLTYQEMRYQCKNDSLETNESYNQNILGRFFTKKC